MANSYKEFLKQMHPRQYSDSTITQRAKLDHDTLSFTLGTISAESREHEFEKYCRAMFRMTVASNLIPQTGPTGGGDSKVDSETYPVDEALAERQPFSEALTSAGERWALAMSAKKEWRSKALSDVRKIKRVEDEYHRGYVKVFFLSNQLISDKKRAEVEDLLREETGLDVRIFDRNWLIDASLSSEKAKVETVRLLGLSDEFLQAVDIGPNDASRSQRLEEVEEQIASLDGTKSHRELIDLADEASELTCELEKSDTAIVGALDRYYRLAMRYGDSVQKALAVYNYAYRIAGWCDDPDLDLFYERYGKLEKITLADRSRLNINNLITLWTIMRVQCAEGQLQADYDAHAQVLHKISRDLSDDGDRTGTSIEVSMRMLPVKLMQGSDAELVLDEAIVLMERSRGIKGIDYRIVAELFKDSETFYGCARYDEAVEALYARIKDDEGASAIAPTLYERANWLQKKGRNYEAIRLYTRALTCTNSHNDKENLLRVCMGLAGSCEAVGLLQLCRSLRMLVLNLGIDAYCGDALLSPFMILSCNRLKYDELRSGNIPASIKLACFESMLRELFPEYEFDESEIDSYDQLLSMALLNVSGEQYDAMPGLVEQLEELGLIASSLMARHALGYYHESVLEELGCDEANFDELIERFHEKASSVFELPPAPTIVQEGQLTLSTKLLGCTVRVATNCSWQAYETARTLLAAFEGFLGTGTLHGLLAYAEGFDVNVRKADGDGNLFEVSSTEGGLDVVVGDLGKASRSEIAREVRALLSEALAILVTRVFPMAQDPETLDLIANEDFSLDRVFTCADSLSTSGDCIDSLPLGIEPRPDLASSYARRRMTPLGFGAAAHSRNTKPVDDGNVVFGEAPADAANPNYHQRDITFSSVIDLRMWDEAGWCGMEYMIAPNGGAALGVMFEHDAGRKVFERWIRNGASDINRIRIVIIKGINEDSPLSYRVSVSSAFPDVDDFEGERHQLFATSARLKTIDPVSHGHLNMFEEALKHAETVDLFPAIGGAEAPKNQMDLRVSIPSSAVSILHAHQITSSNHIACTALMPSDKPIVPAGCDGTEIMSIMERVRSMHRGALNAEVEVHGQPSSNPSDRCW